MQSPLSLPPSLPPSSNLSLFPSRPGLQLAHFLQRCNCKFATKVSGWRAAGDDGERNCIVCFATILALSFSIPQNEIKAWHGWHGQSAPPASSLVLSRIDWTEQSRAARKKRGKVGVRLQFRFGRISILCIGKSEWDEDLHLPYLQWKYNFSVPLLPSHHEIDI